ncbi:MAG: S-adenosylmethionine:tRNA ribosyltransferase-isomerase [Bacteroidota bacterium]
MKDPRQISMDAYDYALPDERIARYPLEERDQSKLLQYDAGKISDHHFHELPELLPAGSLLLANRTRVIHARIRFQLPNEKWIEVFCLAPLQPAEHQLSLSSQEPVRWSCLIGGNRKWKSGHAELKLERPAQESLTLFIDRVDRREGGSFSVDFRWSDPRLSWGEVLVLIGQIPLPPYLGRDAETKDQTRYQTVFAKQQGSVAAPTAGLHFTPNVLERLKAADCQWAELVLHVGAGTFKPVSRDTLDGHDMHQEYVEVQIDVLRLIHKQLESGKPLICVGTTSLRSLESCYQLGRLASVDKLKFEQEKSPVVYLDQWAALSNLAPNVEPLSAIKSLISAMESQEIDMLRVQTKLIIAPGIPPATADAILTNFHQPRSTLLLIIAAMTGEDWKKIYAHALNRGYRFLSYGDSSLLWNKNKSGPKLT